MKIDKVFAYEQLDSRGFPTIGIIMYSKNIFAKTLIPSGISTGSKEAFELRDNEDSYFGKGVNKAINNINNIISNKIIGLSIFEQRKIDNLMIELDGTKNKSNLGANAILAVSTCLTKLAAKALEIPLYEYISINLFKNKEVVKHIPTPMINIINGGAHSNNNLTFQEFMIVPSKNSFSNQLKMCCEIFHLLGKKLEEKKYSISKGDEGGYSPNLSNNEEALDLILESIKDSNYKSGKDIFLAIDVAANELYFKDKYKIFNNRDNDFLMGPELIKYYLMLIKKYPINFIEDPFAENDWKNFANLTKELKEKIWIVGDDLYCTNNFFLNYGHEMKATNSILIKMNQIGTITETLETIKLANKYKMKIIISHRSGDTEESFISDLAVAVRADYIKAGSLSRSERLIKYNRLLEIEINFKNNKNFF